MAKAKFENIDMHNLYDLDMERAILSSVFLNADILGDLIDILKPQDFFLKAHSDIYKAMNECLNENKPIATGFIKNKLGMAYDESVMVEIFDINAIVDVISYAKELKEKSIKRGLVKLAQKVPEKVSDDRATRDIVDEISSEIYSLTDATRQGVMKKSPEIVNDVIEYLKERAKNKDSVGLNTGFHVLNQKTNGFKNGDLIIVAARPAMGKTTLCLNFMQHVLEADKGVVFFSLEMPAEQIMMRMLSAKTSIPLQSIINSQMSDDEITRMTDACEYMSNKKLFVFDSGEANIHQIRTQMRKLKASNPEISLCVIDYIGLMTSTSNFSERHLQIADISRGLKLLARELNMPIIALSQLNRGLESRADKRPMMSDLRESGAIEQDADVVLFVYRENVYLEREEKERAEQAKKDGKEYIPKFNPNKLEENAEIIIGKNRNGETGHVDVKFHSRFTRFVDPSFEPDEIVEFNG